MLFVGCEGNVVHAGAVAAGHGGVVDGRLAAHPGGVGGASFVLDVFGDAEAEVFHVFDGGGDVGGDLVEVVQADEGAGGVQVVAPG